jgi:dolichyl-phosphate beta-glucosyltransferase
VVKKFERIRPQVRLLRVPKNYGKGHAVRTGVLNASGRMILFADADGSTPIEEFKRLEDALLKGAQIAIGSRALASSDTRVTTAWHRKVLGRAFNFCVNAMILPKIADTQCGFKLFTAPAAKFLFERQQSDGFSFDVEILFIARQAEISVMEVPINWTNVPGSKVRLIVDAARMFRDIVLYKVRHRGISAKDFEQYLKDGEKEHT